MTKTVEPLGLYIHVPFCAKACEYCAFYQQKPEREGIKDYLETIERELQQWPPQRGVDTIFMGGGTPSLLMASDLERLCKAVRRAAGNGIKEWTIEMAPSTLKPDKLEVLKAAGVNRFSLGVQSFNPQTLEAIGRPHSLPQIETAIAMLKAAKVENWNIDLIFAAAEETLGDWIKDLERAVAEGPKHISTYCLTFESDTKLFLKMLKGLKRKPSAEEEEKFYRATWAFLEQAGFKQYEVSNFSREGFACEHNRHTWQMREWVAYGPSGAAQVRTPGGKFHRFTNVADLTAWQKGVEVGKRALTDEETLTPEQMAGDALVFGLRMREGVDLKDVQERFGVNQTFWNPLGQKLQTEGLLEVKDARWALTDKGLLLADLVAEEILFLTVE